MENLVKQTIIFVDCKITHFSRKINYTLILTTNDFQDSERERERERERESKGVWNPSPLSSTPRTNERETQLHPTRRRRSEVPHNPTSSAAVPDPLNLTSAHWALHVPNPPRQNSPSCQGSPSHLQHLQSVAPTSLVKHFSQTHPLQYLIHIPSNPSPFSSLLSLNLTSEITPLRSHPYTAEIVAHDPPMTDLSLSWSTCPFPSIFDHFLCFPLSVWQNCLSLRNGIVLIFVFLSLYIEIFYYKIFLEAEKVTEKIAFSECKQTYENIF